MKKLFFGLLSVTFVLLSCGSNELQECKGVVKAFYPDSVLIANVDGDDITFEASDLQQNNAMITANDSVIIHYIGRLSGESKALLVTLIPQSTVVDAVYDQSKELIMREEITEENIVSEE